MSKLWVLVSESSRATLYAMATKNGPLKELECYDNADARQHEQALTSDLPGQAFDGKAKGQHALQPKAGKKGRAALDFAKSLGEKLEKGRLEGKYNKLVLCASPAFLGLLRQQLNATTDKCVIATIDKNLVKAPDEEIRNHVRDALFH